MRRSPIIMKLIGYGNEEALSVFREKVYDEYSFDVKEETSSDGCTVSFDIDTEYIDQKIFEIAPLIDVEINIIGNGWKLVKQKGKGFEYRVG